MSMSLVRTKFLDGTEPSSVYPDTVVVLCEGRTISLGIRATTISDEWAPSDISDEHVRAEPDETDSAWLAIADVVIRSQPARLFPASLLVGVESIPGRPYVITHDNWVVSTVAVPVGPLASFLHTWLIAGEPISRLATARIVGRRGRLHPIRVIGPAELAPAGLGLRPPAVR